MCKVSKLSVGETDEGKIVSCVEMYVHFDVCMHACVCACECRSNVIVKPEAQIESKSERKREMNYTAVVSFDIYHQFFPKYSVRSNATGQNRYNNDAIELLLPALHG